MRILALGLGVVSLVPSTAFAVDCGDLLMEDTVLDHDLDCPGGVGLVVGVNDVSIDLAGHRIAGPRNSFGGFSFPPGSVGLRVERRQGVTVGGGTITGFEVGVLLAQGANSNAVRMLDLDENESPILLEDAPRNLIEANDAPPCDHSETGIRLLRSEGNVVSDNDTTGRWGTSISLEDSHWNVVVGNRLSTDGQVIDLRRSHWNLIEGNSGHGAFAPGLVLHSSHHNRIVGNQLEGDNEALAIHGSRHNWIVDNRLRSRDANGVLLEDSEQNHFLRNHVEGDFGALILRGSDGVRLVLNEFDASTGGISVLDITESSRILLRHNSIREGLDGIFVDSASRKVQIVENLVFDNRDDGIDVESSDVVLRGNVAIDNGDYGIEAVPGVHAVHNSAEGNGNPDQCLNVECL